MPCSQVLERELGGELMLRLKTWGEGGRQEGVIERADSRRGERGREGGCRRDRESCLNDDIMFFHLPHLAQATQGLVFIWIRMLLNLVFVCLPL